MIRMMSFRRVKITAMTWLLDFPIATQRSSWLRSDRYNRIGIIEDADCIIEIDAMLFYVPAILVVIPFESVRGLHRQMLLLSFCRNAVSPLMVMKSFLSRQ